MQPECVALSVVQQIMKQVSRVRILFLLEVEFIRKSRPHWRTGSDVGGQEDKASVIFHTVGIQNGSAASRGL